ncbi:UNVERIFIED_CONTAM: hypothetical protein H355_016149 [Colinus virginianus]|nr:hypothetical protein H355_016149 [Colinus virginianus]
MDTHLANMRSLIQILYSELFELMHQNGDYTHFYFCFLLDFKREMAVLHNTKQILRPCVQSTDPAQEQAKDLGRRGIQTEGWDSPPMLPLPFSIPVNVRFIPSGSRETLITSEDLCEAWKRRVCDEMGEEDEMTEEWGVARQWCGSEEMPSMLLRDLGKLLFTMRNSSSLLDFFSSVECIITTMATRVEINSTLASLTTVPDLNEIRSEDKSQRVYVSVLSDVSSKTKEPSASLTLEERNKFGSTLRSATMPSLGSRPRLFPKPFSKDTPSDTFANVKAPITAFRSSSLIRKPSEEATCAKVLGGNVPPLVDQKVIGNESKAGSEVVTNMTYYSGHNANTVILFETAGTEQSKVSLAQGKRAADERRVLSTLQTKEPQCSVKLEKPTQPSPETSRNPEGSLHRQISLSSSLRPVAWNSLKAGEKKDATEGGSGEKNNADANNINNKVDVSIDLQQRPKPRPVSAIFLESLRDQKQRTVEASEERSPTEKSWVRKPRPLSMDLTAKFELKDFSSSKKTCSSHESKENVSITSFTDVSSHDQSEMGPKSEEIEFSRSSSSKANLKCSSQDIGILNKGKHTWETKHKSEIEQTETKPSVVTNLHSSERAFETTDSSAAERDNKFSSPTSLTSEVKPEKAAEIRNGSGSETQEHQKSKEMTMLAHSSDSTEAHAAGNPWKSRQVLKITNRTDQNETKGSFPGEGQHFSQQSENSFTSSLEKKLKPTTVTEKTCFKTVRATMFDHNVQRHNVADDLPGTALPLKTSGELEVKPSGVTSGHTRRSWMGEAFPSKSASRDPNGIFSSECTLSEQKKDSGKTESDPVLIAEKIPYSTSRSKCSGINEKTSKLHAEIKSEKSEDSSIDEKERSNLTKCSSEKSSFRQGVNYEFGTSFGHEVVSTSINKHQVHSSSVLLSGKLCKSSSSPHPDVKEESRAFAVRRSLDQDLGLHSTAPENREKIRAIDSEEKVRRTKSSISDLKISERSKADKSIVSTDCREESREVYVKKDWDNQKCYEKGLDQSKEKIIDPHKDGEVVTRKSSEISYGVSGRKAEDGYRPQVLDIDALMAEYKEESVKGSSIQDRASEEHSLFVRNKSKNKRNVSDRVSSSYTWKEWKGSDHHAVSNKQSECVEECQRPEKLIPNEKSKEKLDSHGPESDKQKSKDRKQNQSSQVVTDKANDGLLQKTVFTKEQLSQGTLEGDWSKSVARSSVTKDRSDASKVTCANDSSNVKSKTKDWKSYTSGLGSAPPELRRSYSEKSRQGKDGVPLVHEVRGRKDLFRSRQSFPPESVDNEWKTKVSSQTESFFHEDKKATDN